MKRVIWFLVVMILLVLMVSTMSYQTSWAQTGQATSTCAVPGDHATIQAAVDDPACDLVNVGSGTFSENVEIERSVTIQGQGAAATIVDGGGSDHVFDIQASTEGDQSVDVTVTISGLSLINGDSGLFAESRNVSWGAGFAYLTVNVSDCTIRSNDGSGVLAYPHDFGQTEFRIQECTISENLGPGISNFPRGFGSAYLDVINSTISDNSEGGIVNVGCSQGLCTAELNVTGSTVSGNSGSGIYNADLANITNSTISGNTAGAGGGISSCRTTNLYNSTISGNTAGSGGGIIIIGDITPYGCHGAVTASHTIIANSGNGGDCTREITEGPWAATFTDGGHNIIEDGACIDAPTSHSGDPKLGPLANNYGATLTHALLPGSSAIDAGDNAACPATDQRGRPRPEDGDKNGIAICDIGSFEARPVLEYTDLPSFKAAAGGYLNHITFQDLPPGTIVTDQYLDVGALFTDGNDTVLSSPDFVTDGVGVAGNGQVHLQLTRPAVAIGADFPGAMVVQLYDKPGGTVLYTSPFFGGFGPGFFGGVVTDTPFTYAVFHDWFFFSVRLDNIHIIKNEFGSFLPLVFQSAGPGP